MSNKTDSPSKQLLSIIQQLRKNTSELKRLKKIDTKFANIITTQDKYSILLSEKNAKKLKEYEEKPNPNLEKRIDDISDIMFRNFNILSAHNEIFRSYLDEYYDRFLILEKELSSTSVKLERYILDLEKKIK